MSGECTPFSPSVSSLPCPLFNYSHFLPSCCHHVEACKVPLPFSALFFSEFATSFVTSLGIRRDPKPPWRNWSRERRRTDRCEKRWREREGERGKEGTERSAISHRFQRQHVIKHPPSSPALPTRPVLGKPAECKQELAAYAPAVNKAGRMHGSPLVERCSTPLTPPPSPTSAPSLSSCPPTRFHNGFHLH